LNHPAAFWEMMAKSTSDIALSRASWVLAIDEAIKTIGRYWVIVNFLPRGEGCQH
jgi:hypothetical protein